MNIDQSVDDVKNKDFTTQPISPADGLIKEEELQKWITKSDEGDKTDDDVKRIAS